MILKIYTDGACSGNPGPGGWGAILIWGKKEKHLSGFVEMTTNNRMELLAPIRALQSLKRNVPIEVYTDSQYVQKGMTEWIHNWKKKNFKNVKNQDLWEELLTISESYNITWKWVRGHNGDKYNEKVDSLAREAIIKGIKDGRSSFEN